MGVRALLMGVRALLIGVRALLILDMTLLLGNISDTVKRATSPAMDIQYGMHVDNVMWMVATIGRLLKVIGLFCRIPSL